MAGSIRKRGKTSWEVRAYVGKDPATGRKQYATKTVRGTKKEAEVALGRLVAEIDEGRHAVSGGTVGELCEKWFAQAEPDLSPSVAPQYRTLARQPDPSEVGRHAAAPAPDRRPRPLVLRAPARRSPRRQGRAVGQLGQAHPLRAAARARPGCQVGLAHHEPGGRGHAAEGAQAADDAARPGRRRPAHRRGREGQQGATDVLPSLRRHRCTPRRDVRAPLAPHRLREATPDYRARHRPAWGRADREGHQDAPGPAGQPRRGDGGRSRAAPRSLPAARSRVRCRADRRQLPVLARGRLLASRGVRTTPPLPSVGSATSSTSTA